jgi:hypothetical protein
MLASRLLTVERGFATSAARKEGCNCDIIILLIDFSTIFSFISCICFRGVVWLTRHTKKILLLLKTLSFYNRCVLVLNTSAKLLHLPALRFHRAKEFWY